MATRDAAGEHGPFGDARSFRIQVVPDAPGVLVPELGEDMLELAWGKALNAATYEQSLFLILILLLISDRRGRLIARRVDHPPTRTTDHADARRIKIKIKTKRARLLRRPAADAIEFRHGANQQPIAGNRRR